MRNILVLFVVCLAVSASTVGFAAQPSSIPSIASTTINYSNNQITIVGQNFGSSPTVVFSGVRATGLSVNAAGTQITATLQLGIAAGTYLLTVTNGNQSTT